MAIEYVDPEQAIHPLRHELDDEDIEDIIRAINHDEQISLDEIEAAMDYLYDQIAAKRQTHEGVTTLQ